MRYILNSAVITSPGTYTYDLITVDAAVAWIRHRNFTSRVGYPATVNHINTISGIRPALNREPMVMDSGDEALVVRLKYRVANPGEKAAHQPGSDDWEYGILGKKGDG